jgi:hypothetical protein
MMSNETKGASMTSPRYLTVAETAKHVRKALKAEFPGQKFSVRSSSYSGGASITVQWFDGPRTEAVERVAKGFAGATFDGMTDCKNYHTSQLNGETVHHGADFVFCTREASEEAQADILVWFKEETATPLLLEGRYKFSIHEGRLCTDYREEYGQTLFHQKFSQTTYPESKAKKERCQW